MLKYFNDFQNRILSVIWLKWTQKMEIEHFYVCITKPVIFLWDTFKSYTIFFSSKNIQVLQWLSNSKFLSYMTKVHPNSGNETKSNIFPWDVLKSDIIFHWPEIPKIFEGFLFLQKWVQKSIVKSNWTGHVHIWQCFSLFTMWYTI